jgi:hypothetical protein
LVVKDLGGGVVGKAQDPAAVDSGYPCGAVDDGEAQGFHAHKPVAVGAFGRGLFGRGKIAEQLKADSQIMGQNGQLLPCAVGRVMVGGNGVEREFSLKLGKGLFLRPAASDEASQWARAELEVSGDRRILEVAIIGGEEIELVVAPALVSNPLAKDYDVQLQLPNFKPQLSFETGDLRLHRHSSQGPQLLSATGAFGPDRADSAA